MLLDKLFGKLFGDRDKLIVGWVTVRGVVTTCLEFILPFKSLAICKRSISKDLDIEIIPLLVRVFLCVGARRRLLIKLCRWGMALDPVFATRSNRTFENLFWFTLLGLTLEFLVRVLRLLPELLTVGRLLKRENVACLRLPLLGAPLSSLVGNGTRFLLTRFLVGIRFVGWVCE